VTGKEQHLDRTRRPFFRIGRNSVSGEALNGQEQRIATGKYDLVIVHGEGLHQTSKGDFYPSDYRDYDEFGMLGAGMRVAAALEMYLNGQRVFVFTGGLSEKNRKMFGDNCPNEADIYADKFLRMVTLLKKQEPEKYGNLEEPIVSKETESFNTKACIRVLLQQAKIQEHRNIAVISNDYHLPRMKAHYTNISKELEVDTDIAFISAEGVMREAHPGRYDRAIDRYYHSWLGRKRILWEMLGVAQIKLGIQRDRELHLPWRIK
jgi:hypothetical protein